MYQRSTTLGCSCQGVKTDIRVDRNAYSTNATQKALVSMLWCKMVIQNGGWGTTIPSQFPRQCGHMHKVYFLCVCLWYCATYSDAKSKPQYKDTFVHQTLEHPC